MNALAVGMLVHSTSVKSFEQRYRTDWTEWVGGYGVKTCTDMFVQYTLPVKEAFSLPPRLHLRLNDSVPIQVIDDCNPGSCHDIKDMDNKAFVTKTPEKIRFFYIPVVGKHPHNDYSKIFYLSECNRMYNKEHYLAK